MADIATAEFLSAMLPFDEVVTDRLHGAIGAALLGKRVVMRDNSYGKNADVYEFSLAERFPRMRFEHTDSHPGLAGCGHAALTGAGRLPAGQQPPHKGQRGVIRGQGEAGEIEPSDFLLEPALSALGLVDTTS